MKKIFLVSLLSLSFVACSKGGSNSCNANATLMMDEESTVAVEVGSNNIVTIKKESKETRTGTTKYVFDEGGSYNLDDTDSESNEGDSDGVIDFNVSTISDKDSTLPFAKADGEWYQLDSESVKSMLMSLEQDDSFKICSIEKAEYKFKVDSSKKTETEKKSFRARVQLSNEDISVMKQVDGDGN